MHISGYRHIGKDFTVKNDTPEINFAFQFRRKFEASWQNNARKHGINLGIIGINQNKR